ncbi:MAG: hypothetical protein QM756_13060 [Polyangiaceae bacterium]
MVFFAAVLAATGCLSPTLPLPPPNQPQQSDVDESGVVHLTGAVRAESWVYALNQATNKGYIQITGTDGRYDLAVEAQRGDPMVMWYEFEREPSEPLYFEIK